MISSEQDTLTNTSSSSRLLNWYTYIPHLVMSISTTILRIASANSLKDKDSYLSSLMHGISNRLSGKTS